MGPIGTFGAQMHLRQIATPLNLAMLPDPQVYFGSAHHKMDEAVKIIDEAAREELVKFWEAFVTWINRFQG